MLIKILLLLSLIGSLYAEINFNAQLVRQVSKMPLSGGYSVQREAFEGIYKAINLQGEDLQLEVAKACPSFCSSATYLVFLKTLKYNVTQSKLKLSPQDIRCLCFNDEEDGVGFWGRWNANGPGVAKLVADLDLGINFESYQKAQAGDFVKIFWTDEIGKKERGHLVVFLGMVKDNEGESYVKFWSSNMPDGYGTKLVSVKKIKWAIFSRITKLENLKNIKHLPVKDLFLMEMLKRSFSRNEVRKKCAILH